MAITPSMTRMMIASTSEVPGIDADHQIHSDPLQ